MSENAPEMVNISKITWVSMPLDPLSLLCACGPVAHGYIFAPAIHFGKSQFAQIYPPHFLYAALMIMDWIIEW